MWIVAPESDQSGVSHSLSLNDPLRLREVGERHFAVAGTPTDCVIMGARHIMKEMPDLVLSGVNRGRNVAEDVSYSGTVAGAIEGTVLGIPSFALSQAYASANTHTPHWDTAIQFAPDLIRKVLKQGMPPGIVVNVNFPDCPPGEVAGIAIAQQGTRNQELLRIEARHDGRGNPYYWIAFGRGPIPGRRAGHRSARAHRKTHRGDTAAARHDRRAIHDAARRAVRLGARRHQRGQRRLEIFDLERLLQGRPAAIAALAGRGRHSQ